MTTPWTATAMMIPLLSVAVAVVAVLVLQAVEALLLDCMRPGIGTTRLFWSEAATANLAIMWKPADPCLRPHISRLLVLLLEHQAQLRACGRPLRLPPFLAAAGLCYVAAVATVVPAIRSAQLVCTPLCGLAAARMDPLAKLQHRIAARLLGCAPQQLVHHGYGRLSLQPLREVALQRHR